MPRLNRIALSCAMVSTVFASAQSQAAAPLIAVTAGFGAPPKAEVKLADIAESSKVAVPANADPLATARKLCGKISGTYVDLFLKRNGPGAAAAASADRILDFPACFFIQPGGIRTKLAGESYGEFAQRVMGSSGPRAIAALRKMNGAPSLDEEQVRVPFATKTVIYRLADAAAENPEKAANALAATIGVDPKLIASLHPDDLVPMTGIVARNPVGCSATAPTVPDARWPFDTSAVLAALSRNAAFRSRHLMAAPKHAIIAVADNGVDGLRGAAFPDSVLVLNQGEIPKNTVDDDGDGFVDDFTGASLYASGDPAALPAGAMINTEHGTFMASLVLGGPGFRAAAGADFPKIRILPIDMVMQRTDATPAGTIKSYGYPSAGLSDALDYARFRKADVLNFSVGTIAKSREFESALLNNADRLVVVAAAGNDANDYAINQIYPAAYGGTGDQLGVAVITVGAEDKRGCLADFSGRGKMTVDIVAPGVDISGTVLGGGTASYDGTSQAAAFVSFTVGIMKSEGLTNPTAIIDRLYATATRSADLQDFVNSGGALDIAAAISVHSDMVQMIGSAPEWGELAVPIGIGDACPQIGPDAVGRVLRVEKTGGTWSVLFRSKGAKRGERNCDPSAGDDLQFTPDGGTARSISWAQIALLIPH